MLRNLADLGITLAVIALLLLAASIDKPSGAADRTAMDLIKATGLAGLLILFESVFGGVKIVRYARGLRDKELSRPGLLTGIKPLLAAGKLERALSLARSSPCYAGRVLAGVLGRRPAGPESMLEELDRVAALETRRLNSRVGNLLVIAITVLLLGILGTVAGWISTYQLIEKLAAPTPSDLTDGFTESLLPISFAVFSSMILLPAFLLMRRRISSATPRINAEIGDLLAGAAPPRA